MTLREALFDAKGRNKDVTSGIAPAFLKYDRKGALCSCRVASRLDFLKSDRPAWLGLISAKMANPSRPGLHRGVQCQAQQGRGYVPWRGDWGLGVVPARAPSHPPVLSNQQQHPGSDVGVRAHQGGDGGQVRRGRLRLGRRRQARPTPRARGPVRFLSLHACMHVCMLGGGTMGIRGISWCAGSSSAHFSFFLH